MPLFPSFAVARNLKDIQGCRTVIALTHMRTPNDLRLAKEVEEIDLILGGHDHVSEFIEVITFDKNILIQCNLV
jgi:2',3'-cyclic-nucleotide 2'-phosphodiesterase (5'-nucleotidase family)